MARPERVENPFYYMAPQWALYPLVALATAATIIASQAVITGSFSLTWQAVQLGFLPRFEVRHTAEEQMGQIYIPTMNWLLMAATLGLVLGFRSSSGLAEAFGVAVTTTMVITTVLIAVVMRRLWHWPSAAVFAVTALFLVIDLAFFGANIVRVPQGGWFPLLIGLAGLIAMATWRTGRRILRERLAESGERYEDFQREVAERAPRRVPGTAVFLTSSTAGVPPALLWLLKHAHVLHERILLLNVSSADEPHVRASPTSSGARSCSPSCRVTRAGPRPTSGFRPIACSRSGRRSSSEGPFPDLVHAWCLRRETGLSGLAPRFSGGPRRGLTIRGARVERDPVLVERLMLGTVSGPGSV